MTDFDRALSLVRAETDLAAAMDAYRRANVRNDRDGMKKAHNDAKKARHEIMRLGHAAQD